MKILYPILALSAFSVNSLTAGQRVNVVLIMADQCRFDFLGAVNPQIITPALNALCADGVRFANAYSSTPSSTPARAAILTAQSPWHHGLLGYAARIAPSYPHELQKDLAAAGYYMHAVGKMHWTPQRGLRGYNQVELDESGRAQDSTFISDYHQWFTKAAPGVNPDSTGIGWNDHRAAPYALPEELHPTAWTGQRARAALDTRDSLRPFFLKVSFARPHSPYDAPQRYLDMYRGHTMPEPWVAPWAAYYANMPKTADSPYADYGAQYALNSRLSYAANLTFIDHEIGLLVAELKARGLYENTLIIFTSDHGDMLGDHNHWRKTYPYEGSAHVPMVVKLPQAKRGEQGVVRTELVEMRDIMPTVLDAAGIAVPKGIDGRSMLATVRRGKGKKSTPWRSMIDLEHTACYMAKMSYVALVDQKMKYVWYYEKGTQELFDLQNDKHEMVNLAPQAQYRATMDQYRAAMAEHLAERGEDWVKDGILQIHKAALYSPNFPGNTKK
ncbi:MAG: arylsulfatase [Mucinivorans sp.]